jgi:hypothetical protein
MRRFAIAGFVTVAMSLPFLGGTVESYASEGPWCDDTAAAGGAACAARSRSRRPLDRWPHRPKCWK